MKKWAKILISASLVLNIAGLIIGWRWEQRRVAPTLTLENWLSFRVERHEDVIEATPGSVFLYEDEKERETVDLLYGPYFSIDPGNYVMELTYETDALQSITISGRDQEFIHAGDGLLQPSRNKLTYRFNIGKKMDLVEVILRYKLGSNLKITDVRLETDTSRFGRWIFLSIVGWLVVAWIAFKPDWWRRNKTQLLIGIGMIILVSAPVLQPGIYDGDDIKYHLNRIEAVAQGWRDGQFPVRNSSFWLGGYGYASSIYYPDLWLYPAAVLRVVGFGVVTSYQWLIILINAASVAIAYYSFGCATKNKKWAWLATLLYVGCSYRLLDAYVREALGELLAMSFLPLLGVSVYELYTAKKLDKAKLINLGVRIALAMSGLVESHIITFMMTGVLLAVITVILIKKTIKKEILATWFGAIVLTLLLNAWFLVPFAHYYLRQEIRATLTPAEHEYPFVQMQAYGVYVGQLFSWGQGVFGAALPRTAPRYNLSLPLIMIAIIIAAPIILVKNKRRDGWILWGISLGLLILASNLFPWDWLIVHSRVWKFLSQIQFPWRWLSLAMAMITLLGVTLTTELKCDQTKEKYLYIAILSVLIIYMGQWIGSFYEATDYIYYHDGSELNDDDVVAGEYLSPYIELDQRVKEPVAENVIIDDWRQEGLRGRMRVRAENGEGGVMVPVFVYPGWRAYDRQGDRLPVSMGWNFTVRIAIPADYTGEVTYKFAGYTIWRLAEIVSLGTIMTLLCYFCTNGKKCVGRGSNPRHSA